MQKRHVYILGYGGGKQLLLPIAGIGTVFCQKEKIFLVFAHLVHQCIVLTAAGRSKNNIPLLQLCHYLIKFCRQLAMLIQQSAIHIGKNNLYHILHPCISCKTLLFSTTIMPPAITSTAK